MGKIMNRKTLARRLLQMLIVLFGITFLTLLLTYLAPGDPDRAMYEAAGVVPTEEMLENARLSMGFDKPFLSQYENWLASVLHGNLGESFSIFRRDIMKRYPVRNI